MLFNGTNAAIVMHGVLEGSDAGKRTKPSPALSASILNSHNA